MKSIALVKGQNGDKRDISNHPQKAVLSLNRNRTRTINIGLNDDTQEEEKYQDR